MVFKYGNNSHAKEMAIRKRIANIYNRREEDFPSLRDYNDYLEEVEDMIFNLIEGIDVAAIEAKISKYQEENAEQIINARARKAEELAAALAASKGGAKETDTVDMFTSQSSQAGTEISGQGQYVPAIPGGTLGQPRPTGMVPQPVPVGSDLDTHSSIVDDEEKTKLIAERGARAGGWTNEISRRRALEEAFNSIWV